VDLTPVAAELVNVPMIDECYANLECKVADTRMVNKYNMFVLEVVKAWVAPKQKKTAKTLHHVSGGKFLVGGKTVKAPSKKK